MILLDENILETQRALLEAWRIHARQVGSDVGRKGLKDGEIVVLLRKLRRPTFITRDLGFFDRRLRHRSYGIAVAAVGQSEAAAFVRRFLRHPEFRTESQRMGKVVRLSPIGISVWSAKRHREFRVPWPA